MNRLSTAAFAALVSLFFTASALAASDAEISSLREEIESMKAEYENRISRMEDRLREMEKKKSAEEKLSAKDGSRSFAGRTVRDNDFNPAVGVVFGGRYANFSSDDGEIPGFPLGHEGERGKEGISIGETEVNLTANVDDKFRGSMTTALADHGGAIEVELEEAYVETLPGLGLPAGAGIKAGRAFWTLGYLNEHHSHVDDFADRPLPYRAFLDKAFNDDGAQVSYVLPTGFYVEVGGGVFRGDDFPFGGASGGDVKTFSGFARVGGDIGRNSSFRIGGYILDGKASGRAVGDGHGHGEEGHAEHDEHEEHDEGEEHGEHEEEEGVGNLELFSEGAFTGDTRLYIADMRYTWAPTGNPRQQELILQGEYFRRAEKGLYVLEEGEEVTERRLNGSAHGWYAQGVYKFTRSLRAGVRYSRLHSPGDAGAGQDPYAIALMTDWTNSEFSRWRLQYNRESFEKNRADNQFILQYVMSIGAHGAHKY